MPKAKIEKDTSERWLLTYADLMNLLLIFFIILYAISQVDQSKYNALSESFKEELLGEPSTKTSMIEQESDKDSMIEKETSAVAAKKAAEEAQKQAEEKAKQEEVKQQQALEGKINDMIKSKNIQGSVEVTREDRGLVITISTNVLFESGSAEINPEFKNVLVSIAGILKETYPNQIAIEGHTDNDPIHSSRFPTNWELSSARATEVLRFLVDNYNIEPSRISAVGYGEFRPKAPNDTLENKAKNRRVNVVIIDKSHGTTMAKPTVENSTKITPNANAVPDV